jgi:hypothetical protein
MNTLTDSDFVKIQQEFDEDENMYKWTLYDSEYINYCIFKTKALSELKLLYEKFGEKQLFDLASSAIQFDSGACHLNALFKELPDETLENEYNLELAELNRKFLSKALAKHDPILPPINTIKYLAVAIANDEISREFIDAVRLHPDSTLFSKEYIETYAESLKNGSWYTNTKPDSEIIQEGINKADEFVLEKKKTYDAIKLYERVIEMISLDQVDALSRIHNIILKIILCHIVNKSTFDTDYDLKRFANDEKYNFKESKQYTYLCIANSELNINTVNDITLRDEFLTKTKEYIDNESDPIIIHLLLRCKDSILRFNTLIK